MLKIQLLQSTVFCKVKELLCHVHQVHLWWSSNDVNENGMDPSQLILQV